MLLYWAAASLFKKNLGFFKTNLEVSLGLHNFYFQLFPFCGFCYSHNGQHLRIG